MKTRRDFLATLGIASAASIGVPRGAFGSITAEQAEKTGELSEYMLAPGLTYLNTGSLGPSPRAVLDRTIRAWTELESNPVGMTWGKGAVIVETDRVRERAAAFLGCDVDELLITRSTTDGMNSLAQGIRLNRGDRVLMTNQEHEGGSSCWHYLAKRQGLIIDEVPIAPDDHDTNGIVKRFTAAITRDTRVISVSHVISSTGLRMPIAEIAALAQHHGILCIVDGAQAVGGIAVNVKALGCHAYATSGHKWLMGPKGTGLAYIRRDASKLIEPIQREGGNRCVEGSTGVSSLPLIVGLGAAIELMNERGMATVESRNIALRNRAYAGLKQLPKIRVVSAPPGRLVTALVSFILPDEIESRAFQLKLLEKHKIVLKMAEKRSFNGIRISPHIFNTEADIDRVLDALRKELA